MESKESKKINEIDFLSVHSREEIEQVDKRIMATEKEYEARMLDANMKAKDIPMTN